MDISPHARKIGAALKYALAYVEKEASRTPAVRDASDIEESWRVWLPAIAPKTFTAEFESFHANFLDWYWALLSLRAAGESVPENFPRDGLLALGRGLGKSTILEAIALAEGAMVPDSFGVYISSTQDKAKEHLASIRSLLESSEIAKYYPGLANPRLGKFGNQRGWNAEAIYTDNDFGVVAVSLEKGIRGLRDEERRPTFILVDDIDERDDSPVIKQEKFDTIRFDALPMLAPFGLAIFAQNLIYSGSIMDDTLRRKLDWFHLRHTVGPVNTFKDDLEIEKRDGRPIIISGTPNWSRIDRSVAQDMLNKAGEESFWRECQNKTTPLAEKLVWTGFSEEIHVISWSQFAKVFGSERIPSHWFLYAGYDAGTTGPERHPGVFSVAAVSAENSAQPEDLFLIYEYVAEAGVGEDEMAKSLITELATLCHHEGIQEAARLVKGSYRDDVSERYAWEMRFKAGRLIPFKVFRGSHEAASERNTFRQKWGLPIISGKPGKTEGLSQLRFYLKPESKPHPFKAGVLGRPNLYLVVADEQLDNARDRFGLARHRWEASNLKWDPNITTRDVPTKFGDDATDACFVAGTLVETEFGPVSIESINVGDRVWTREGLRRVTCAGMTSADATVYKLTTEQNVSVVATAYHPVWITRDGVGQWMPLSQCSKGDKITVWKQSVITAKEKRRSQCLWGSSITDTRRRALSRLGVIFRRMSKTVGGDIPRSMSQSGNMRTGAKFPPDIMCITETAIRWITSRTIWNACLPKNITGITVRSRGLATINGAPRYTPQEIWRARGIALPMVDGGTGNTPNSINSVPVLKKHDTAPDVERNISPQRLALNTVAHFVARVIVKTFSGRSKRSLAPSAGGNLKGNLAAILALAWSVCAPQKIRALVLAAGENIQCAEGPDYGVRADAVRSIELAGAAPVYNLTVEGVPEYFANGLLVHNCKQYLQTFAMTAAPLTEREKRNLEMPENLREENAPPYGGPDPWARDGWELGRIAWMGVAKRRKEMSGEGGGNHWANDIYGNPGLDDPWNSRSPLDGTTDDPWSPGEGGNW